MGDSFSGAFMMVLGLRPGLMQINLRPRLPGKLCA